MNATAIAQHLNIAADAIVKIEEWAQVLWVKFVGGCKFVSKKVVKAMEKGRYAVSRGVKQPALFVSDSLKECKKWAEKNATETNPMTVWATANTPYRLGGLTLGNRFGFYPESESLIF
jgi:hypothetical protein